MVDFEKLLNLRNSLIDSMGDLCGKIKGLLKRQDFSKGECDRLNYFIVYLQRTAHYLQGIGKTVPEYFVGDLLDVTNYIKYFDRIFYGENFPVFDDKNFGHKKLDEIVMKRIGNDPRYKNFDKMDQVAKDQILNDMTLKVIYDKASYLPSTERLYENIDKVKQNFDDLNRDVRDIEQRHHLS